jgi:UDP-N-acetylglucosamine acyltransferase
MPNVHPTAIVSPRAELAAGVTIGPHAIVEAGVRIGEDTTIGPGSCIMSGTTIGARNRIHMYVVIGNLPQDWHYVAGDESFVEVGDDNTIREFVTIHRGCQKLSTTKVGSGNTFMATSHVGHNSTVGDRNTLANGALLAGHVEVASRCFLSGNAMVHQFNRVGRLAMVAGGGRAVRDVPPFCLMEGESTLRGLNRVGLRRAGFNSQALSAIGRTYRRLFMSDAAPANVAREILAEPNAAAEAIEMAEFVLATKRSIARHGSKKPHEASAGDV